MIFTKFSHKSISSIGLNSRNPLVNGKSYESSAMNYPIELWDNFQTTEISFEVEKLLAHS